MNISFLYRMGGLALILSGAAYLLDTGLDALYPGNMFGVGILVSLLGLFGMTAIFFYQYENSKILSFSAYILNFVGLSGLVAIAFFNNLVKPKLAPEVVQEILSGEALIFFALVGFVFLAGALLMGVAVWIAGKLPKSGAVIYALGAIPVALPPFFPNFAIELGGVAIAAALILWGGSLLMSVTSSDVEYV